MDQAKKGSYRNGLKCDMKHSLMGGVGTIGKRTNETERTERFRDLRHFRGGGFQ